MAALTEREEAFRKRILGRRRLFLTFSILGSLIGLGVLAHALLTDTLTAQRGVLVILVLLLSRSHLRQYRSATILWKMDDRCEPTGQPPQTGGTPGEGRR